MLYVSNLLLDSCVQVLEECQAIVSNGRAEAIHWVRAWEQRGQGHWWWWLFNTSAETGFLGQNQQVHVRGCSQLQRSKSSPLPLKAMELIWIYCQVNKVVPVFQIILPAVQAEQAQRPGEGILLSCCLLSYRNSIFFVLIWFLKKEILQPVIHHTSQRSH